MMSGMCRSCGYDVTRAPDDQGRAWKAMLFGLPMLAFFIWLYRDLSLPQKAIYLGLFVIAPILRFVAIGKSRSRN